MKDVIKRAEQGERIILVFRSIFDARYAFEQAPESCTAYSSRYTWMFESGGTVRFMSVQTGPYSLRGLDADVIIMPDAVELATRGFLEMAEVRASMYHLRRSRNKM